MPHFGVKPSIKTEKQRMLAGELYHAMDPQLVAERQRAQWLCQQLRQAPPDELESHAQLLAELFATPVNATVVPPFFCDYGTNIRLGSKVFINANCVFLDVLPITIGDRVLIGPAVQIYTATHPLSAAERAKGLESGSPVSIGADVWIGGGAILCPGVDIGAATVIGAGSVVTRSIPAGVFAAGNPCRIIRQLE